MGAINLPFVPRLFSKLFVKQYRARSSNKTPLNERTDGLLKKNRGTLAQRSVTFMRCANH